MIYIPQRVIDRVLTKVEPEGDCLVSTYAIGKHGYARVGWHEARQPATGHRSCRMCARRRERERHP